MKSRILNQRLLALFVGGWLLFDFPLLRLALAGGTLFGLPRGPVLIFLAWALLERSSGKLKIALIEMEGQPGYHTTGRSAAFWVECLRPRKRRPPT